VERIELNADLVGLLLELSLNIGQLISTTLQLPTELLEILLQIRELVNAKTSHPNHLPLPKLIELLGQPLAPATAKILLREVYLLCFQNPFTEEHQLHYICSFYPHTPMLRLPTSAPPEQTHALLSTSSASKVSNLSLPNYKETRELEHLAEWAIQHCINKEKISLGDVFAEIVEKEIGQIMHAVKGYAPLHFLNYLLQYLA
jgi:hypothetical protein